MKQKAKNWLLVISIILNAIFFAVLLFYAIKNTESLTQRYVWRFNTETVIMFGDSHTARGNWNVLLDRCDVLKIGYSGFTSGQLVMMMKAYIVDRNAAVCFIQCGGNDLNRANFDPKNMENNISFMIHYLKANHITPVLQSLFHRPNQAYNQTIDSLNVELEKLALNNNVDFIDVNFYLDENNNIAEHVVSDKVHLNPKGYEIWGKVINDYLEKNGI